MLSWIKPDKKDIVKKVPLQLDLESSSVCDLECPMCFQAYDNTKPASTHMPIELYTPECLCILSMYPFHEQFDTILKTFIEENVDWENNSYINV